MTRAELQAVQGSENRGERFWHPGPQVPDLPRYHETEAIKCVQHSVGLCVPSQPHETPVSKTTKPRYGPRGPTPQHCPRCMGREQSPGPYSGARSPERN